MWRIKKADPVLGCMGVFWLGRLWLEFISYWMNQRNVSLLTKMLEPPFHALNVYIYNNDKTEIALFFRSIYNVTVTIYSLLSMLLMDIRISFNRHNYLIHI